MSSADLFEDGFPHGTKEGYDRGCRGHGSCPGVLEYGRSCNQASMHYSGDYEYRKRVDAGLGPAEIAELERAAAPVSVPKPGKRVSGGGTNQIPGLNERVFEEPTVTVATSETPLGDLADDPDDLEVELVGGVAEGADFSEAEPVEAAARAQAERSGIEYEKHGETKGYYLGCRDKESCPGFERVGRSCTQAVSAYQKDLKERRKAEAGLIAPNGAEPAPEPVEAVVEAEKEHRVDSATEDLRAELAVAIKQRDGLDDDLTAEQEAHLATKAELAAATEQIGAYRRELDERASRVAKLTEDLVQAAISLDVEKANTRDAAVVALRDTPPVRNAGLGLSFAPTEGGGVSVQLEGGTDPVRLELEFTDGRLLRAGVTTGA